MSIKMHRLSQQLPPGQLVDVLIAGDPDKVMKYVESIGGKYKYATGNLVAARIPAGKAEAAQDFTGIDRIDPGWGKIVLLDNKVDTQSNAWKVRQGVNPLKQGYTGKNVVIGFLDTGIDLDHPDFWNKDSTTRVRYIWDQTLSGGPHTPVQYGYGTEWDSSMINAGQTTHKDQNGHGTKVAGLAAGNGNTDSNFTGMAPDAEIVIVKVDLNGSFLTNVVDGVNYILKKADELGRPVVINASLGTYGGSHDGKDLAAQAIDHMLREKPGRMMVAAAGNAGHTDFHLGYDVTTDTSFTWFKYNSKLGLTYLELWADTADFNNVHFQLSADAPGDFETCYHGNFFNVQEDFNLQPGIGIVKDSIITSSGSCIGVASYYVELVDDRYVIDIVVRPDSTNYLFRFATTGSGHFDLWSDPSLTGTSKMVSQIPSITEYPPAKNYKLPDNKQTIVSSWACSPNVLTVGSFVSREAYRSYNGIMVPQSGTEGAPHHTSSLGPTRTGAVKPNILASGQNALTTLPLWERNNYLNNNLKKLASSGWHTRFGGTSSSAPIATGAVALLLQRFPDATTEEIINAISQMARADSLTGSTPNNKAGFGKLDVFAAITAEQGCTDPVAINYNPDALIDDGSCLYDSNATGVQPAMPGQMISIYPNPLRSEATITADLSHLQVGGSLAIFSIDGKQMTDQNFSASARKLKFDAAGWPRGVYLIRVFTTDGQQLQSKIIKP